MEIGERDSVRMSSVLWVDPVVDSGKELGAVGADVDDVLLLRGYVFCGRVGVQLEAEAVGAVELVIDVERCRDAGEFGASVFEEVVVVAHEACRSRGRDEGASAVECGVDAVGSERTPVPVGDGRGVAGIDCSGK